MADTVEWLQVEYYQLKNIWILVHVLDEKFNSI